MLEARGVKASGGRLTADVQGKVAKEEGVLVIRLIHVKYQLQAAGQDEEKIERAFSLHPMRCPVYRTLHRCIKITTELAVV